MTDAKITPLPWYVVEIESSADGVGKYTTYAVADESGRVIMDATNSSVASLEYEDDGEPSGFVSRWDEQSKNDAAFIVRACNSHEAMKSLLAEIADYISPENDMDYTVYPLALADDVGEWGIPENDDPASVSEACDETRKFVHKLRDFATKARALLAKGGEQ